MIWVSIAFDPNATFTGNWRGVAYTLKYEGDVRLKLKVRAA